MQIECSSCQESFGLDGNLVTRELENDVTEAGLVCPGCQKWYHSFYLNSELIRLQNGPSSRQQRREYKEKFEQLQKRLKKQYGTNRNRSPVTVDENDGTHQAIL